MEVDGVKDWRIDTLFHPRVCYRICRGEGSENKHHFPPRDAFSDPSPLRAQSTKSSIMEMIFDDVVYSLSSSALIIRMVIS
jgi:hypothetical protein